MQEQANGKAPPSPPQSLGVPIDQEEFLAAIGELYLQTRIQRRIIIQLQQQSIKSND